MSIIEASMGNFQVSLSACHRFQDYSEPPAIRFRQTWQLNEKSSQITWLLKHILTSWLEIGHITLIVCIWEWPSYNARDERLHDLVYITRWIIITFLPWMWQNSALRHPRFRPPPHCWKSHTFTTSKLKSSIYNYLIKPSALATVN